MKTLQIILVAIFILTLCGCEKDYPTQPRSKRVQDIRNNNGGRG